MSCCGRKRAEAAGPGVLDTSRRSLFGRAVSRPEPFSAGGGITLRYAGSGPLTVRGPRTGRIYVCSAAQPLLRIDASDVDALVRTRLFVQQR